MLKKSYSKLILILLSLFSICSSSSSSSSSSIIMSNANPESSVYIVYTEKPTADADHESFHLSTLSSVLGCVDAAKDSLVYVYKNAATGFSAKLTPEQVSQLERQPGVIQVVESKPLKLHGGSGATNMRM